jgi:hypothetical protein
MQIVPIRKTSKGIIGTYANAEHHAKELVPMIHFFETQLMRYKKSGASRIDVWKQGHNVHEIGMQDGRKFVFRPIWKKGQGYVGISFGLKITRGVDYPLFNMFYDLRNNVQWQLAIDVVKAAAKRKPFSSYQLAAKDA